jgi:hypothetical protein
MFCSVSLCVVDHDDENPIAPASMLSRTRACIAAISSGVASRRVASRPITTRRTAECPTLNAALTDRVWSSSARYSAVVFQFHGTPSSSDCSGMPSTRLSIRIR